MIRARKRRVPQHPSGAEVSWLQPYPDRLLDELHADDDGPGGAAVARETIGP